MESKRQDMAEYLSSLGYGSHAYAPPTASSFNRPETKNLSGDSNQPVTLESCYHELWSSTSSILVILECSPAISQAEWDLFYKMVGAIGIREESARLLQISEDQLAKLGDIFDSSGISSSFNKVLILGSAIGSLAYGPSVNWTQERGRPRPSRAFGLKQTWLATVSPLECLQNPSLKKVAWEDLKSFKNLLEIP